MCSIHLYHTWWRVRRVICRASKQFLAKPQALFTGPVLQEVMQREEGCSMKGSNFSPIYCQMHTVHVFAGRAVPQWTALLRCLMACRVLRVFLFSLFLDLDLRNSSCIDIYVGSLIYQALWYSSTPTVCLGRENQTNSGGSLVPTPAIMHIMKRMCVLPGAKPACDQHTCAGPLFLLHVIHFRHQSRVVSTSERVTQGETSDKKVHMHPWLQS